MAEDQTQSGDMGAQSHAKARAYAAVNAATVRQESATTLRRNVAAMARAQAQDQARKQAADYVRSGADPVDDLAHVSGLSEADWERILPDPDLINDL